MDVSEYQNLVNFITSNFVDFPNELSETSSKSAQNKRENFKKKARKFYVNGGKLFRNVAGVPAGVEVVKEADKDARIREFHSSNFGGHSGVNKTIAALKNNYWWFGLTDDVKEFVRHCERCQKSDPLKPPKQPELKPIQVTAPFELVGVDLIGPLTESNQGNRYIFTATDYFTKWVEAFPIPNKTAAEVARCFEKMFSRHGAMKAIITDQGREFVNELNTKLCQAWNIDHRVSAAYHPQTNGLDERTNQTIKSALRKLTNEEQTDWDERLDGALFSIRTKPHSTTKYSPFFLLYGREAVYPSKLPENFEANELPPEPTEEEIEENVKRRQESTTKTEENVRENIKKAQEKMKKDYKKRTARGRAYEELKVGDKVLMFKSRDDGRKSKHGLGDHYTGPYVIVEVKGFSAKLKNSKGVILKKMVPFDNLKKFYSEDDSTEDDKQDKAENNDEKEPTFEESQHSPKPRSSKEEATEYVTTMFEDGTLLRLVDLIVAINVPDSSSHNTCPVSSFAADMKERAGQDEFIQMLAGAIIPYIRHLDISLTNKTSMANLMAGICAVAINNNCSPLVMASTLKSHPDHLENVPEVTGPVPEQIKAGGETLSQHDMATLDGNNWLNDKILNAYITLLKLKKNEGDTHIFVMPSYVAVLWDNNNLEHYMFRRVKFSNYKWVLMPVNVNGNHWVLLAANVKERTVGVMDSLSPQASDKYPELWRQFMQKRDAALEEKLGDWTIVSRSSNQQKDGNSCGIFVLMNAECLVKDVPVEVMRQIHVSHYRDYVRNRLYQAGLMYNEQDCDSRECKKSRAGVRRIECCVCRRWYHLKCVNITARMARDIKDYQCIICNAMYG